MIMYINMIYGLCTKRFTYAEVGLIINKFIQSDQRCKNKHGSIIHQTNLLVA